MGLLGKYHESALWFLMVRVRSECHPKWRMSRTAAQYTQLYSGKPPACTCLPVSTATNQIFILIQGLFTPHGYWLTRLVDAYLLPLILTIHNCGYLTRHIWEMHFLSNCVLCNISVEICHNMGGDGNTLKCFCGKAVCTDRAKLHHSNVYSPSKLFLYYATEWPMTSWGESLWSQTCLPVVSFFGFHHSAVPYSIMIKTEGIDVNVQCVRISSDWVFGFRLLREWEMSKIYYRLFCNR